MIDATAQEKIEKLFTIGSEKMYARKEDKFILQHNLDEVFTKTLLIYVASYYETKMINTLKSIFKNDCSSSTLTNFVTNSMVNTQNFSKLANWEIPTPEQKSIGRDFFVKFGQDFADYMRFKMDAELKDSIMAFSKIIALRNKMIHGNLAEFDLDIYETTIYDIRELYGRAEYFVESLNKNIAEYHDTIPKVKLAIKEGRCVTAKDISSMLDHICGKKFDINYCSKLLKKWKPD